MEGTIDLALPVFDYGPCPCGDGVYESGLVEVRIPPGSDPPVLEEVPQGACPHCGARVYKAGVLEVIEAVMRRLSATHPHEPA